MIGIHKTKIIENGGTISVRYHDTVVFQITENGDVQINSGGWQTATTKKRINQCFRQYGINAHLFQKDFTWYVDYNGSTYEFFDNMILGENNG